MNRPRKIQRDTKKKVLEVSPRFKPTWNFWNQRSNLVLKCYLKRRVFPGFKAFRLKWTGPAKALHDADAGSAEKRRGKAMGSCGVWQAANWSRWSLADEGWMDGSSSWKEQDPVLLAFAFEDSFATWRASTWLRGGEVLWGKTWAGDPEPKVAVVCGQGQGSLAWVHLFPTQDDEVNWEFLRCCAYSAGPTYTGWGAFSGCAISAWGCDKLYGKGIAISAWAIAELKGISWVPPSRCGGERPTGRWKTFAPWSGWCRGRSNQRLERGDLRPWGDSARCEGCEGPEAWRYAIWPWPWKGGEGKVHSWTDWWGTSSFAAGWTCSDAGWCWGACWRKVWTSSWASTWHLELFRSKRNKWNRELKYLHFWTNFRVWNWNYIGDYLNAGDDFNRWDNWVLWTWPGWGSQQWQQPRPYVATKDAGHQRRSWWKRWIWTGASWPIS